MTDLEKPPTHQPFSPTSMAKMSKVAVRQTVHTEPLPTQPQHVPAEETAETKPEPKAGDIVTIEGVDYKYRALTRKALDPASGEPIRVPYTYRSYYAHTDPETGLNGPGWDSRLSLANNATALRTHGRTFTRDQVISPLGQRISSPEEADPTTAQEMIITTPYGTFDISKGMPNTPALELDPVNPIPEEPDDPGKFYY